MADTVNTIVIENTLTHYVIHLTGSSDGTGETNVIKADKSTLLASDGAEPDSLDIQTIRWVVQGYASIKLSWDHTTDDTAMLLAGSGYDDFSQLIGDQQLRCTGGLKDPRSAGGTGDVLLTSNGATAGATYDITIWFIKNPN